MSDLLDQRLLLSGQHFFPECKLHKDVLGTVSSFSCLEFRGGGDGQEMGLEKQAGCVHKAGQPEGLCPEDN